MGLNHMKMLQMWHFKESIFYLNIKELPEPKEEI